MTPARSPLLAVVAVAALLVAGCSDPTLQEACAAYCEAVAEAGCPDDTPEQCAAECDQIEEQLGEECVEEYTDAYDCASGEDFECREGRAAITSQGCLEEALTVLECQGVIVED